MSSLIKRKTIQSLLWSALERFGYQGIRAIITLVLARLLTPDDFGVIGILLVFIVIAEAIINNGFGQAVIQKKEVTENDLTTAFILSLVISFVLYIIIFLSSGLIADFYGKPELLKYNRVLSLIIVLDSFIVIQRATLQREMNFKSLSVISIVSSLISGVVGIGFAYNNLGVWSLIAQMLTQKLIMVIYMWIKSRWLPKGKLTKESFTHMFNYGWKLQLSGIISQSFRHINSLIIGKFFSVELVGFYTQAKNLKDLPVVTLSSIVSKVTFPAFSSFQDDKIKLKHGYKTSMSMLVFISFPLMLGMLTTAERLIPVFLGEQWEPSVRFFQLLCLVGMLYPLQTSNINILKVLGRTDLFLILEIAKKSISIIIIIITIRWGIYALIVGQVFSSYISLVINVVFSGRLIEYRLREQITDWLPYLSISIIMAIIVRLFGVIFINSPDVIILIFQVIIGVSVYIFMCKLFKLSAFNEVLKIFKDRNKK